jgi:hypothetical protein
MKIVFLCGSLEPGRDGVGDYTRRLAAEIMRQGHQVSLIALNDHYVHEEMNGMQNEDEISLTVLRMPADWSIKYRSIRLKKWIDIYDPKWLSLQFVPFSFNDKGLPFGLSKFLKKIGNGRSWHIMIHELWVGKTIGYHWKQNLYSVIQKKLIKQLINSLNPLVIHTHLPAYYSTLKKLGWNVKELPLFSNISVLEKNPDILEKKIIRVGIFSQAETVTSVINFLIELEKNVSDKQMAFEVLLIGKGIQMQTFGKKLEQYNVFKTKVRYTGFLEPKEISYALQSCTVGLTSIPRHALGKSGSVAAFLTHDIPVAAPNTHQSYNPNEIGFFSERLHSTIISVPDFSLLEKAKKATIAAKNEICISAISATFLSDIQHCSPH